MSPSPSIGREAIMAPEEWRRSRPESGEGDFEGRDLLVGRPGGAEGRRSAGAAGTAQAKASPQPGAHDAVVQEILQTVRATAARIDALQDAPGPEHEAPEGICANIALIGIGLFLFHTFATGWAQLPISRSPASTGRSTASSRRSVTWSTSGAKRRIPKETCCRISEILTTCGRFPHNSLIAALLYGS